MNNVEEPSPSSALIRIWLGIFVGLLATAVLYLGLTWVASSSGEWRSLVLPSYLLVPMVGGVIASYIWRTASPSIGLTALNTLAMTLLGLGGAAYFLREGIICLLIVSPLFYVMLLTGALLGRIWFRNHLSIVPICILLAAAEPFTRAPSEAVVTDEIVIAATPEKVWPLIQQFGKIPAPPAFWLFRLGLPYPESTLSEGNFVGAKRQCIFSGNAVFRETIAEFEPARKLTFTIDESPPDPELLGHLTPVRGQFELRDNGNGTTVLRGSTWYYLHVRPLWYFNWWTDHIFRAVHLRVMNDVRRRAETAQ